MVEIHAITKNLQALSEELVRLRDGPQKRDSQGKIDPSELPVAPRRPPKEETKKAALKFTLVQEDAKMIVGMQADRQTLVVDQPEEDDASSHSSQESYSGRSSSSHMSDISYVDPEEWDTDKWYQSIRVMFDKLQNKQEWDMMMALRKAFDGRSLERQQAFEKIAVLDEERQAEADHFQKAQQKFDKDIEDVQVNVFSSLSTFDRTLQERNEQFQERKLRKRRKKVGIVGFDLANAKNLGHKRVVWSDQDEKGSSEDNEQGSGKADTIAGDLLRLVSGQQNQIAALRTSSVLIQKKVYVHKAALRHVETSEKTGLDVEISEEVQNVLIDIMAQMETKDGLKPKTEAHQEPDALDMTEIFTASGDTSYNELLHDKKQSAANRELLQEIMQLKDCVKTVQDSLAEFMTTRGQNTQAGIARRKRKALENRRSSHLDDAISRLTGDAAHHERPGIHGALHALFQELEKLPVAERFTKLQGKMSQMKSNVQKAEEEKKIFEESIKNADNWKKKLSQSELVAPEENMSGMSEPNSQVAEVSPRATGRRRLMFVEDKVSEDPVEVDKQELQRRKVELKKRRQTLLEANSEKQAVEEAVHKKKTEWQQLASNLNSALGEAPPKTIEEGKVVLELQDEETLKLSTTLQQLKHKRMHQLTQSSMPQNDSGIKSRKRQLVRESQSRVNPPGEEPSTTSQMQDVPRQNAILQGVPEQNTTHVVNASDEKESSRNMSTSSRKASFAETGVHGDSNPGQDVGEEDEGTEDRKRRHRHRRKRDKASNYESSSATSDGDVDAPVGFTLTDGAQGEVEPLSPPSVGATSNVSSMPDLSAVNGKKPKRFPDRSKSIRASRSKSVVSEFKAESEGHEVHASPESLNHLLEVQRENIELNTQLTLYKDMLSDIQKKGYLEEEKMKTLADMHGQNVEETPEEVQEKEDLKEMKNQVKRLQKMLKSKRQLWNEVNGDTKIAGAKAAAKNRATKFTSQETQRPATILVDRGGSDSAEEETGEKPPKTRSISLEVGNSKSSKLLGRRVLRGTSNGGALDVSGELNVKGLKSLRDVGRTVIVQNMVKRTFADVQLSLQGSSASHAPSNATLSQHESQGQGSGSHTESTPRHLRRQSSELAKTIHTTSLLRAASVLKFATSLKSSIRGRPETSELQVLGVLASPKSSTGDPVESIAKSEPTFNIRSEEAPSPRRRSSLISARVAQSRRASQIENFRRHSNLTMPNLTLSDEWVDLKQKVDLHVVGQRSGSKERVSDGDNGPKEKGDHDSGNPRDLERKSPFGSSVQRRMTLFRVERSLAVDPASLEVRGNFQGWTKDIGSSPDGLGEIPTGSDVPRRASKDRQPSKESTFKLDPSIG